MDTKEFVPLEAIPKLGLLHSLQWLIMI